MSGQQNATSPNGPNQRPLSPHLQVWKWTLTMALSILHRVSGAALSLGMLMVVWMLFSAASGADSYACFYTFITSFFGQLLLFGWTGAMYFHLCSGIRHLIMDAGYLITVPQATKAGYVIFIVSIAMTFATWGCVKFFFGGV